MDKRFIFRYHQDRADGGTQEGRSSGPTGHGPWPVVAGFGWEIPRVTTVRTGPRLPQRELESITPPLPRKASRRLMCWCPYRKPTLVGR